jgi:hypothetical protein
VRREEDIRVRVTKDEYENIKANADVLNMKVIPYIRKVAQNPNIIHFNYSAIERHTQQVGQIERSINLLIYTIHVNNDYLPKEIEGILDYMKKIWESENKLLDEVGKQWKKANKPKKGGG